VLSTVATTLTENQVADGTPIANAAVNGFQAAFWVGAGIALAGVVAALVFIRKDELETVPATETVPALDLA
jgi:hypothetical protein